MSLINEENLQSIIDMYNSGMSLKQIAELTEISSSNIKYHLHKNNVQLREAKRKSVILNADEVKIIHMYVQEKMKMLDISNEFGCSITTIWKILKANGVRCRKPDETHVKYKINDAYFDNIDTPNKAYILGLMYADGSNTSNYNEAHYRVRIGLKASDIELLENINFVMGSNHPIRIQKRKPSEYNREDTAILDIPNKKMVLNLDAYGVVPNKTHIVTFPSWLAKDLFPHFIRGLFDGDGCILKDLSRVQITGTISLCNSLHDIISNELGVKSIVVPYKNRCAGISDVIINSKIGRIKFLDWIYHDADLKLSRKYDLYIKLKEKYKDVA